MAKWQKCIGPFKAHFGHVYWVYSYCYPNELLPFFLILFFPLVHCYFLSCYFFSYLSTVTFFPVTFFPVTFFPTWNCYFLSCYFLSVHRLYHIPQRRKLEWIRFHHQLSWSTICNDTKAHVQWMHLFYISIYTRLNAHAYIVHRIRQKVLDKCSLSLNN